MARPLVLSSKGYKPLAIHIQPPARRERQNRPQQALVVGRCDRMAPEQARREAHRLLGMVAIGEDSAAARARNRRMPSLRQAFEEYMKANPGGKARTNESY